MAIRTREASADGKYGAEEIRAERSEYNGRSYVNIRKWFQGKDGEWYPTKKGITFLDEHLFAVQQELDQL
jgi:hypothetical protein